MRLFKNGIELKYILLVIGILAVSGIAIATTDPIIGDNINYLDALNITRWIRATQFIDANNTAYYVDPAGTSNLNGVNITKLNSSGSANATVFGDTDNTDYYIDPANNNISVRVAGQIIFPTALIGNRQPSSVSNDGNWLTFLPSPSGYKFNDVANSVNLISVANGGAVSFTNGISTTSGTDTIACIDPTTFELTKNTGSATTCAASAEKYKNIKGTFTDSLTTFMSLNPIIFQAKDDIKKLDRLGFNANKVAVLYPQVVYTRYQGNGTFVKIILNQSDPTKADNIQYSDGTIAPIEGINYEMFSAILVSRVQQQQEQLDTQSTQIRNICTNSPALCS